MTSSFSLSDGTILLRLIVPKTATRCTQRFTESIPEISPWLPWCHAGYSRDATADFIKVAGAAWDDRSHYPVADGWCFSRWYRYQPYRKTHPPRECGLLGPHFAHEAGNRVCIRGTKYTAALKQTSLTVKLRAGRPRPESAEAHNFSASEAPTSPFDGMGEAPA